jgi:hypothetical protein
MKTKSYFWFIATMLIILTGISCEKIIEVPPSKSLVESKVVFENEQLATAALMGAYHTLGTVNTRMKYLSLYADEYSYSSITPGIVQFKNSTLLADNNDISTLWRDFYSVIYQCNALLEGLQNSAGIHTAEKNTLAAEAKFLRAFSYLYLVNLFDRVPVLLTTDVSKNRSEPQSEANQVYVQIIKDLSEAKEILSLTYHGGGKVRANKAAATALLARVYLYQGKWDKAIIESGHLISSETYLPLPTLANVFKANSKEAILQFWVINGFLSDASTYIPSSATVMPTYPITDMLYQAFTQDDQRKIQWIGTNQVTTSGITKANHYPYKYKNRLVNASSPEYIMALRLTEQYLIRAEAYAQLNQTDQAIADINVIRVRASMSPITSHLLKDDCLIEIHQQRRLELFGEWAHRFIDLKRAGQIDVVMEAEKPTWKSTAKLLPIPTTEITYNKNLIQNENY